MIVEAVDQDAAHTALAYVAEGDLGGRAVSGMPCDSVDQRGSG
jgi:hypothetical protein